jgi:hypothetical protein
LCLNAGGCGVHSLLEATFETEANGLCLSSQCTPSHAKYDATIHLSLADQLSGCSCPLVSFEWRKKTYSAPDEIAQRLAFRGVVHEVYLIDAAICVGFVRYDAGLDTRAGYGANSTPDFCESPDFTGLWMNCG